jgi:hypothetical protein
VPSNAASAPAHPTRRRRPAIHSLRHTLFRRAARMRGQGGWHGANPGPGGKPGMLALAEVSAGTPVGMTPHRSLPAHARARPRTHGVPSSSGRGWCAAGAPRGPWAAHGRYALAPSACQAAPGPAASRQGTPPATHAGDHVFGHYSGLAPSGDFVQTDMRAPAGPVPVTRAPRPHALNSAASAPCAARRQSSTTTLCPNPTLS